MKTTAAARRMRSKAQPIRLCSGVSSAGFTVLFLLAVSDGLTLSSLRRTILWRKSAILTRLPAVSFPKLVLEAGISVDAGPDFAIPLLFGKAQTHRREWLISRNAHSSRAVVRSI